MLSPDFKRPLDDSVNLFLKTQTTDDLAILFEIPKGQLLYILYTRPEEEKYHLSKIPKRNGGFREIAAPLGGIAILQKKLLYILEQIYQPKPWVQAFTKNRSILTNAKSHAHKRSVLNIDLNDFFGTINFGRVRGLFMAYPFFLGENASTLVAQLATYRNVLPQGSPISPIIANMIAYSLDRRLMKISREFHLFYTRYADDITFSTTKKNFPKEIIKIEGKNDVVGTYILGAIITEAVRKSGFRINMDKVRLQKRYIRQEVTGLTVNQFPNVHRQYIRNLRAMIYAWKTHGIINAERKYIEDYAPKPPDIPKEDLNGSYYKNVIYGKLAFLSMIRGKSDHLYIKYCLQLADLDKLPPKQIVEAKKMHEKFDVFLCHASEDKKEIVRPIFKALKSSGIVTFLDEEYIKWGDSFIQKINQALGRSRFVIAVLSTNSVDKSWPVTEISVALAQEIKGKQKLLPLMVGSKEQIEVFETKIPLLNHKKHLTWKGDSEEVVESLKDLMST